MKSTKSILIQTTPKKLWDVLTQSEYTKQYMFNCSVESDWKVGCPIIWQGNFNGYDAFQKGEIIEIEEGKRVTYSTFDPNFGLDDIPENYIRVTYDLKDNDNQTQLTIHNETFDGNEERMGHINQGWDIVIGKIKEVAEQS